MSVILQAVSFAANNTEAVQMNYADDPAAYLTEWDTTTIPTIAAGKSFYIGGSAYRSVSPGAIGGTVPSSDGTYYIKVVLSTMAVEWETSAAAYSWDESNGGWYNGITAYLLPCEVEYRNSGEWLKKQWINPRSQNEKISSVNVSFSKGIASEDYFSQSSPTEDDIYEYLSPFIPNINDTVKLVGEGYVSSSSDDIYRLRIAKRATSSSITLFYTKEEWNGTSGVLTNFTRIDTTSVQDNDATVVYDSLYLELR